MPTDEERREVARRLRGDPCDTLIPYRTGVHFGMGCHEAANRFWDICERIKSAGDYDIAHSTCSVLADLIEPEETTGETSDGYHTFNELYDHRAKLFSVIVCDHRELAWKSMLHHDGTMYDGMFIVGIETPDGQATYHYDVDPYWGIFDCEELDRAPEWDGHTPQQAIERIAALGPFCDREALLALADEMDELCGPWHDCGEHYARRIREACGEVG